VVTTEVKCGKVIVYVDKGVALDCQGDPIYVPSPQSLSLDTECTGELPPDLWVVLCRTEKCCAPRTALCSGDDDESAAVCTRERDGFEIRIVSTRPKCSCDCEQPDPKQPHSVGLANDKCRCVNPEHPCYQDHYLGKCGCDCENCGACDCDCVLLAYLTQAGKDREHPEWQVDHRVRRFIRPMLMRDPQVWKEEQEREKPSPTPTPTPTQTGDKNKEEDDSKKKKRDPAAKAS
jgi:hypothetical protein